MQHQRREQPKTTHKKRHFYADVVGEESPDQAAPAERSEQHQCLRRERAAAHPCRYVHLHRRIADDKHRGPAHAAKK